MNQQYMTRQQLEQELKRLKDLLDNYEELGSDMENHEYVARGNGFCDAKYSEDFLEGQQARLRERIAQVEKMLSLCDE